MSKPKKFFTHGDVVRCYDNQQLLNLITGEHSKCKCCAWHGLAGCLKPENQTCREGVEKWLNRKLVNVEWLINKGRKTND